MTLEIVKLSILLECNRMQLSVDCTSNKCDAECGLFVMLQLIVTLDVVFITLIQILCTKNYSLIPHVLNPEKFSIQSFVFLYIYNVSTSTKCDSECYIIIMFNMLLQLNVIQCQNCAHAYYLLG